MLDTATKWFCPERKLGHNGDDLFMITRVMQSILKVIIKCTKFKFIQSGYLGD